MQLSPGWGRQGHPAMEHEGIASVAPSAVPLEIDLRNLNKGWVKQFKRLGGQQFSKQFDEFGGLEKLQSLNDEEYKIVKEAIFSFMEKNSPEQFHVVKAPPP